MVIDQKRRIEEVRRPDLDKRKAASDFFGEGQFDRPKEKAVEVGVARKNKKQKKWLIGGLVLMVVVGLGGFGYYYLERRDSYYYLNREDKSSGLALGKSDREGEVVVSDEKFGIRVTEVLDREE